MEGEYDANDNYSAYVPMLGAVVSRDASLCSVTQDLFPQAEFSHAQLPVIWIDSHALGYRYCGPGRSGR